MHMFFVSADWIFRV